MIPVTGVDDIQPQGFVRRGRWAGGRHSPALIAR
jgi:hypothetical protein